MECGTFLREFSINVVESVNKDDCDLIGIREYANVNKSNEFIKLKYLWIIVNKIIRFFKKSKKYSSKCDE